MTYHLKREVVDGVVNVSIGMPEADAYLEFVKDSCRFASHAERSLCRCQEAKFG